MLFDLEVWLMFLWKVLRFVLQQLWNNSEMSLCKHSSMTLFKTYCLHTESKARGKLQSGDAEVQLKSTTERKKVCSMYKLINLQS